MPIKKIWLLTLTLLVVGNTCSYFFLPLSYYFLPFWGKVTINGLTSILILGLVCIIGLGIKIIPTIFNYSIPRKEIVICLMILPLCTFIQTAAISDKYTVLSHDNFTLYNFTRISDESVIIQHLANDIQREINSLATQIATKKSLHVNVCVFSSANAMREGTLLGDNDAFVYYDSFKNTIYVWVAEWHRSIRHELIHCFQRHTISLGILGLLYERFNYWLNPLPSESEAYFFAPFSGFLEFTVDDFASAVDTTDAIVQNLVNLNSLSNNYESLKIEQSEALLASYIISTLYHKKNNPKATFNGNQNSLSEYSAKNETMAQDYIRYYFSSFLPMHAKNNLPFTSLIIFKKHLHKFSKQHIDSIAKFNRYARVTLEHKIEWENLLDTLGTSQRDYCWQIFTNTLNSLEREIHNEDDLRSISETLKKNYDEALQKNYTALSAYIYIRLAEYHALLGWELPALKEECRAEYNRSYLAYLAYLRAKTSSLSTTDPLKFP